MLLSLRHMRTMGGIQPSADSARAQGTLPGDLSMTGMAGLITLDLSYNNLTGLPFWSSCCC